MNYVKIIQGESAIDIDNKVNELIDAGHGRILVQNASLSIVDNVFYLTIIYEARLAIIR